MTFAAPLGLLALLSIPAIVAIHLFRRRFPVRQVAGLFLWQTGRHVPQGGGRRDTLPITPSLILECLAALALSLILAGARLSSAAETPHLVVLLDDSASMNARVGNGSVRDRAVRRVLDEIERLGRNGRITLVRSGDRPAVIAGPAAFAAEGAPALEAWAPAAPHHSLALGLRLARELAGQTGRLMVMSDTTPASRGEPDAAGVLWVAVGEPLANVGIVAAERTLSPEQGRGTITLALGNYSDTTQSRRVSVRVGDKEITATQVAAPPGVSSVKLPLPPGLGAARVTLSDDALRRDNEVVLVEPRPHVVGVENRLADGRGRDALTRALMALTNVTAAQPGHLQFVEGGALGAEPAAGVWRVAFGQPPPRYVSAGEARDFIGPFLQEKRSPLLAGVTLGGVVWAGASPLKAAGLHPLVSAGDTPVLVELTADGSAPTWLFNLDLARTNLIRAPDWPILISNLVELRRQNLPGPERWNYRIGEWVRVRLGREPKGPLRLRSAGGERSLPQGRFVEFTAPASGGLVQILEGQDTAFELGVNFLDEAESDLRHGATADSGAFAQKDSQLRLESGIASDPLFWILLAVAAGALLANWCLPGVERRLA